KDLGPLEILLISDENKILKDSLSVLGPRQRQVIWLFYVEEMSIGDIAHKLNISYRTVVNSKTKALKRLKKEIEREGL
ncbi:MAG: sigma-70 family RNA polymerase sigma factor, partial [Tissierellia bacterium]|nr:sigma-70 family RNA polymerase sigma factor [Tissierellia bacterium]